MTTSKPKQGNVSELDSARLKSEVFPFETENPSGVPGLTEVQGQVIAAIASHVATGVEGVVSIGRGGLIRAVSDILSSDASSKATGVEVEAGRKEAILDLDLTVEYGHSIPKIVKGVREAIASELYDQIGLVAKEINVIVSSIEFPERPASPRVQ